MNEHNQWPAGSRNAEVFRLLLSLREAVDKWCSSAAKGKLLPLVNQVENDVGALLCGQAAVIDTWRETVDQERRAYRELVQWLEGNGAYPVIGHARYDALRLRELIRAQWASEVTPP